MCGSLGLRVGFLYPLWGVLVVLSLFGVRGQLLWGNLLFQLDLSIGMVLIFSNFLKVKTCRQTEVVEHFS